MVALAAWSIKKRRDYHAEYAEAESVFSSARDPLSMFVAAMACCAGLIGAVVVAWPLILLAAVIRVGGKDEIFVSSTGVHARRFSRLETLTWDEIDAATATLLPPTPQNADLIYAMVVSAGPDRSMRFNLNDPELLFRHMRSRGVPTAEYPQF